MHITLTGNLGSGKSTICKILDSVYGYEIFSTGTVQRELAKELGISVLEMNQLMCKDKKYDHMIDDMTAKISRENTEKSIVFDSRLAWHFVEKSFKVFLSVSLDVAANRVYADNRGDVEKYTSLEDALGQLRLRAETEDKRYKELYNVSYFDFNNYNLVLDSTYCTPELLARVMLAEAKRQEEAKKEENVFLISPKRLGLSDAIISAEPSCYYQEETVTIEKSGDEYVIVSGREIAEKAAKEGIPFVRAVLA
ncbi:MAG: hypothetical protein E7256_03420 [Lachnospiraceae bacterium]|nr:hypothetical protein [Lachnospiraceae bacterium]